MDLLLIYLFYLPHQIYLLSGCPLIDGRCCIVTRRSGAGKTTKLTHSVIDNGLEVEKTFIRHNN